jgi:hypothetical protein
MAGLLELGSSIAVTVAQERFLFLPPAQQVVHSVEPPEPTTVVLVVEVVEAEVATMAPTVETAAPEVPVPLARVEHQAMRPPIVVAVVVAVEPAVERSGVSRQGVRLPLAATAEAANLP